MTESKQLEKCKKCKAELPHSQCPMEPNFYSEITPAQSPRELEEWKKEFISQFAMFQEDGEDSCFDDMANKIGDGIKFIDKLLAAQDLISRAEQKEEDAAIAKDLKWQGKINSMESLGFERAKCLIHHKILNNSKL